MATMMQEKGELLLAFSAFLRKGSALPRKRSNSRRHQTEAHMKVFVAGATGALGVPVVQRLVARGHKVIGLTRSPSKRELLLNLGARPVIADALDAEALESAVRAAAPEAVIHLLTAIPKRGLRRFEDVEPTNRLRRLGTRNLIAAARAAGVRRLVGESVIFAYGFGDLGARPLLESDLPPLGAAPEGVRAMVEATRSLEDQILEANQRGQLEGIVLRFGMLYGPRASDMMIDLLHRRRLPIAGGGRAVLSLVHVEDAADATVAALESGRPGAIYNVVDDEPVVLGDFLRALAGRVGAPAPRSVPLLMVKLLAPYAADFSTVRVLAENEQARRELHWAPVYTSWRRGIGTFPPARRAAAPVPAAATLRPREA
jgi:nucleoside-diphosphate-sugar epimerase